MTVNIVDMNVLARKVCNTIYNQFISQIKFKFAKRINTFNFLGKYTAKLVARGEEAFKKSPCATGQPPA